MHFIVLMDGVIFESPVPQDRLDWFSDLRGQIPQKIALYLTSISQLVSAWQADVAEGLVVGNGASVVIQSVDSLRLGVELADESTPEDGSYYDTEPA